MKPDRTRRLQAAAIAVHAGRVCLITSRRRKRWIIPKGNLEAGKAASEVAEQEAWEEAGLLGKLHERPVGTYDYAKSTGRFRVTVFLMNVSTIAIAWPESHHRKRCWVPVPDVLRHIEEPGLRKLVRKAIELA